MKPLIHLNGSSPETMIKDAKTCLSSVKKAIAELRQCAPHQRDYYPLEESKWLEARKEYTECLESMEKVEEVLTNYIMHIMSQRRDKV